MFHKDRVYLIVAVLSVLLGAGIPCRGQEKLPEPSAAEAAPVPGELLQPAPAFDTNWPASTAPAREFFEDTNGRLLVGDPLLDRPYESGDWFAAVEVDVVKPFLKNRLTNTVDLGGGVTDRLRLANAELDWTGAPKFDLGYRLPQGFGGFLLSYQFLVSEGADPIANFDAAGPGTLRSRLNVNIADVDYVSHEYALGDSWDMKWKIGARFASLYFDSRGQGALLEQRTSNLFFGAGPHASLDLWRWLGQSGLAGFGGIEGAGEVGRVRQSFAEVVSAGGVPVMGGATRVAGSQWVPTIHARTGIGWSPPRYAQTLRFLLGYEFNGWWYLGRLDDSAATLTINGLFVSGQWNY